MLILGLSYASVPLYQLFCQATGFGGTTQKDAVLKDFEEKKGNMLKSLKTKENITSSKELFDTLQTQDINPPSLDTAKEWSSSEVRSLEPPLLKSLESGSLKNLEKLDTVQSLDKYLTKRKDSWGEELKDLESVKKEKKNIDDVLKTKMSVNKFITINLNADVQDDLPWTFKPTMNQIKVYPGDTALTFFIAKNTSENAISGISSYNVSPAKVGIYFNKIQCFCFEEQRLKGNESMEMPVLFFVDKDFVDDPRMLDVESITLSYTFFKSAFLST